jgi:hypothetical protein
MINGTQQTFANFLKAELKQRGIERFGLPCRTGLKPGSVSYLLPGKRAPDEEAQAVFYLLKPQPA